ncbi:hypothetical protein B0T17DRAFT_306626 [Bombardia bombarda]|uniref:Uncharacterized protein n=1 Tax=Bombardia bombarda TaxID=252184 RepID=A0AA39WUK6_9PEZI|nr:hypothetical protein B0T17DRAFT_306626 [Bombardia bombarda]
MWTERSGLGSWQPVGSVKKDDQNVSTPYWVECVPTRFGGLAPHRWQPVTLYDLRKRTNCSKTRACMWNDPTGPWPGTWQPVAFDDNWLASSTPPIVSCTLHEDGTWWPASAEPEVVRAIAQAFNTKKRSEVKDVDLTNTGGSAQSEKHHEGPPKVTGLNTRAKVHFDLPPHSTISEPFEWTDRGGFGAEEEDRDTEFMSESYCFWSADRGELDPVDIPASPTELLCPAVPPMPHEWMQNEFSVPIQDKQRDRPSEKPQVLKRLETGLWLMSVCCLIAALASMFVAD